MVPNYWLVKTLAREFLNFQRNSERESYDFMRYIRFTKSDALPVYLGKIYPDEVVDAFRRDDYEQLEGHKYNFEELSDYVYWKNMCDELAFIKDGGK